MQRPEHVPDHLALPAVFMRGGTSKGLFLLEDALPPAARVPGAARDALLLRLMGSPDPYGAQTDGMGGATPSTSKVILVRRSARPGHEVEYLFGAVGIDKAAVDWSANCGNLTAAVAPFAIRQGLLPAGPDGTRTVRMWQANIGQTIVAHVRVAGGVPQEAGEFLLDGVAFPSSEIVLEFLGSAGNASEGGGTMLPTGNPADVFDVPGFGAIDATLITDGAPTLFVRAAAFGLTGTELKEELAAKTDVVRGLLNIRAQAAVRMGLAATLDAAENSLHVPRVAFVAPPASYRASDGRRVAADAIDLLARILSQGRLHHAMTGTGAVALAVAAAVPGTVVASVLAGGPRQSVCFGHPSGSLRVGADVERGGGAWTATRVVMSRSARTLMAGSVYCPLPV